MILAKNNIIVQLETANEYAIFNPISGNFDLMDENEHAMLFNIDNRIISNPDFKDYLLERGYAYRNSLEENLAIENAYHKFKTEINQSQVQLMLVPTYNCNLACTYCFQHGIKDKPTLISKETVDSFFLYARKNFTAAGKNPFITLFGGEPLVNSNSQRDIINYIVDSCAKEAYELAVVTNGYDLVDYIDVLQKVKVKEIQVTLDGSQTVHDTRRATANKKGTYNRIVNGIQAAITAGMPINLRSVVDAENIRDIVNLAEFLDAQGWLDLPPELFKTQIGRNYELFDCYAKPQHLMSQVKLWAEYAALSREYPVLARFHRPDFKGIRHLVDTGEMYMASFDTCPAAKTEWVFDLYGNIYGCTASCGREEYLLGTFWPEVALDHTTIETWQNRDVTTIPQCRDCKYDVVCGGGCGVVAHQKNGKILSPDCRPIQQLFEIGVNHYLKDLKGLGAEDEDGKAEAACCSEPHQTSGCLICGEELLYSTTKNATEQCLICGLSFETNVICPNGHFICDACHSMDILGKVEQLLIGSSEKNPVALAQKVFELPELNTHGPEHDSIVPAVMLTAYQNASGARDAAQIREAIKRGRDVPGGSCGFNGNCGAAVGAGITTSIIEGATPLSSAARGHANRSTGYALIEISKYGGPRCCKRESILTIESFMRNTNYFDSSEKSDYVCHQSAKNKECIGRKCPYFPNKTN